jgi:hypothetical protein
MARFKFRQIGLALCLMASLLVVHVSACTCAHHESAEPVETDCHSHHGSHESVVVGNHEAMVDDECICVVDQASPYLTSPGSKQVRTNDEIESMVSFVPVARTVGIASPQAPLPSIDNQPSYSYTLESLLPSRAPPRL